MDTPKGTLTLTLPDGRNGTLSVDNDFASLSSEDQQGIIDQVQSRIPALQNTIGGDLKGGLHDLGEGVSSGLRAVGGVMSRNGMPEWGGAVTDAGKQVEGITPAAPAGPAPVDQMASAIKNGNWSSLPGLALHSAVRAAAPAGAVIGAGALAGPAAAGLTAGGLALGPIADARAQNNGRQEPNTSDVVESIPGTAVSALGGMLLPGGSKFASPLARAGAKVASEATGGMVMDAGNQLGGSVGTDKGTQFDPTHMLAAGIAQGTVGAGRVAKDAAGSAVTDGLGRVIGATVPDPANLDQAASIARLNKAADDLRGAVLQNTGRTLSDTETLNSLRTNIESQLRTYGMALRDAGAIDADTYRSVFSPAFDLAARHNKELFSSGDPDAPSAWDRLQALDLPAELKQPLVAGLTDLTNLSVGARVNQQKGPFESIARIGGALGGMATGGVYGGPGGLIAGGIAAASGHSPTAAIAGRLGRVVDNALGTRAPQIIRQGDRANDMLTQAGVSPGPSPLASIANAQDALRSAPAAVDAPTPAATPDQIGAAAAQRNQAAMVARLGPDHPVGSAAADALTAAGRNDLLSQALTQWNSMAGVRKAQSDSANAAQVAKQKAADDAAFARAQAEQEGKLQQARRSDAVAAFDTMPPDHDAAAQSLLDNLAIRNEAALRAADMTPTGDNTGLTAQNAAVNMALAKAKAVRRAAGETVEDDAPGPKAPPPAAPTAAQPAPVEAPAAPVEAPQQPAPVAPAQSGLLPLSDYLQHVALARYGHLVTPEHLSSGLDALASRGGLTPDQYGFYKSAMGAPLQNPGGIHQPFLDAIAAQAVGAKNGTAPEVVSTTPGRASPGPSSDQSGVRNPLSYAANLRQEATTAANIVGKHPELSDAVNQIRNAEVNQKTAAGRKAVMESLVGTIDDPVERARVRSILLPLTGYGQKGAK